MKTGKAIIFLLMLFALSLPMPRAVSAQSAVTLKAQAGIGGVCKVGAWMPVRVTVENRGADLDARVQASFKNGNGGTTIYGMDLVLPATSRKEFFLYVFPNEPARNFAVSVLAGNNVVATTSLNISCRDDALLLFGILADTPSTFSALNDIRPLVGTPRSVQLTIPDLPDRAEGWAALDALVISNVDTGTLTPEQKQALKLWIAKGGKLFVTGGMNWQATTAGLQDLLPVAVTATKNAASLSALSAYVKDENALAGTLLASGKIQNGAHVLVEQNGVPLLVEDQIGYGSVYYFAADPGMQPLNDWDGMKKIYDHLLFFDPQRPMWADARWDSNQAGRALAALPELNLPSFFYILCWLGLYIFVIGPLNYFILRRAKRTELAWVTIPALVILFSCLAYFSGYAYRGFKPVLNRIALAQAWDGVEQSRVNALVGVYSPNRTAYAIETQDQFMLYPPIGMNDNLQGNNDWLSLKTAQGTLLPDTRVEIGGMRSVGLEGSISALDIQHDLQLTLNTGGLDLAGTITNASQYTVREAVLVTPDAWTPLGDLPPNETVKINHSLSNVATMSSLDMYSILSILNLNDYSSDIDQRRRSFILQASAVPNYNSFNMPAGVYLIGWVDDIPTPVGLREQASDTVDTTLYFKKLEPSFVMPSSSFILTSGMYHWRSSTGYLFTSYLPEEGYVLRFQPGIPVHIGKVNSLNFDVQATSTLNLIKFSLWDFESETWTSMPLLSYTNIPDAARYVGIDGEIRVMLAGDQNNYIQISSMRFTLAVEP
jgi:hypothetical protein